MISLMVREEVNIDRERVLKNWFKLERLETADFPVNHQLNSFGSVSKPILDTNSVLYINLIK